MKTMSKDVLNSVRLMLLFIFCYIVGEHAMATEEDKPLEFELTSVHMDLLQHAVVAWHTSSMRLEPLEVHGGAPTIHPLQPYGSSNLLKDIQQLAKVNNKKDAQRLHRETEWALQVILQLGELKPGTYSYSNPLAKVADSWLAIDMAAYRNKGEKLSEIRFDFTPDHKKLLQNMIVQWCEDHEIGGYESASKPHNVPCIDPTRPYGMMTNYPREMALKLGKIDVKHQSLTKEEEAEMTRVHYQMQEALQVYLRYASIPLGKYRDETGYGGDWKFISPPQ